MARFATHAGPQTTGNVVLNKIGEITAVSGGSGCLDGIETANGATTEDTTIQFIVTIGGSRELQQWYLKAGTDANDAYHQRPLDYDGSTNAFVWERMI